VAASLPPNPMLPRVGDDVPLRWLVPVVMAEQRLRLLPVANQQRTMAVQPNRLPVVAAPVKA